MSTESVVQQYTRLMMAQAGGLPMRNNVGVAIDATGRHIRYGLMNESKQQNRQFKSSDVVGPVPIVIQSHHVGKILGVLATFECKHSDWKYSPNDEHSVAQNRFHELMRSVGCIAGFVTDGNQVPTYIDMFR